MATNLDTLIVCCTCGELRGTTEAHPHLHQQCQCNPAPAHQWDNFDFPRHSELCGLCATLLIPTGSRWSRLLCIDCTQLAAVRNDDTGFAVVPLTRHTLPRRTLTPHHRTSAAATAASDFGGTRAALADLTTWRTDQIRSRLPADTHTIELRAYLTTNTRPPDRPLLLNQFIDYRHRHPGHTP